MADEPKDPAPEVSSVPFSEIVTGEDLGLLLRFFAGRDPSPLLEALEKNPDLIQLLQPAGPATPFDPGKDAPGAE